jgi:hypothetical protein
VYVSVYFLNPANFVSAVEQSRFGGAQWVQTGTVTGPNLNNPAQIYNTATGLWKVDGFVNGQQRRLTITSAAGVSPIGQTTVPVNSPPQIFLSDFKPWQFATTWRRLEQALNSERGGNEFVFDDQARLINYDYFKILSKLGYDAFLRVANAGGRLTLRGNAQLWDSSYQSAHQGARIYTYPPVLGPAPIPANAGAISALNIWGYFLWAVCMLFARNIASTGELYSSTFPPTPRDIAGGQDPSAGNTMDYDIGPRTMNGVQADGMVVHDRSYLQKHQWDLLRFCARLYSGTI